MIPRFGSKSSAFTLIELLTVIAIIGVLAGITFGVMRGAQEKSARGQAASELAALAQALESFKRQYGDYPQTGTTVAGPSETLINSSHNEYKLFNALAGKYGPKVDTAIEGRAFTELAKFTLLSVKASDQPSPTGTTLVANAFVDPWGQLYQYYYRPNSGSNRWNSFVLFSAGPDGKVGISVNAGNGSITISDADQAADNIYANP
jgi:prepilin-type N-terminal cleavage/methylation domain-containing protein